MSHFYDKVNCATSLTPQQLKNFSPEVLSKYNALQQRYEGVITKNKRLWELAMPKKRYPKMDPEPRPVSRTLKASLRTEQLALPRVG